MIELVLIFCIIEIMVFPDEDYCQDRGQRVRVRQIKKRLKSIPKTYQATSGAAPAVRNPRLRNNRLKPSGEPEHRPGSEVNVAFNDHRHTQQMIADNIITHGA